MATKKATAKKTAARKPAAKKVTKSSPKKCATCTCKKKCAGKDDYHKFIVFGLVVTVIILCGSLGAMAIANYTFSNNTISSTATTTRR